MKSKTRTIGIIIISILLLVLISIIIYNVVYLPSIKEDKQPTNNENDTPIEHLSIDGKSLEICKEGVDCGFGTRSYYTISTDIVDEQLTNVINELNTKINNSYTRSLNATDMTISECSNVSNLYQRSIMTESILNIYDSENMLGITLISSESNLCLSTNTQEIDIVYYDVNNKKMLTESEVKENYSITDEEIVTAVTNDINQRNIEENLNYTTNVVEYHIYFTSAGEIGVYYRQPEDNIYYSIALDKKV